MKQIHVVTGLAFGDEGKGLIVDYLCSKSDPSNTIVVRYNGGHQAGHTVKIGDITHIHSNFGAGTLRGCPSYISEYCAVYPNTLYNEYIVLKSKGVSPVLYVDPDAIVCTPYDVAYNRISELRNNHGSCGLGVGATMKRHHESPYKFFARDLLNKQILTHRLSVISNQYYDSIFFKDNWTVEEVDQFQRIANDELQRFRVAVEDMFISNKIILKDFQSAVLPYGNIIFEGAQGVMLDEEYGFFPHVTYSNTTSQNAIQLISYLNLNESTTISAHHVTRCYQTRHGNGPMTSNAPVKLRNNQEETNVWNEHQKSFKTAILDSIILQYTLGIEHSLILNTGPADYIRNGCKFNLYMTCMDQLTTEDYNRARNQLESLGNQFRSDTYISIGPTAKDVAQI